MVYEINFKDSVSKDIQQIDKIQTIRILQAIHQKLSVDPFENKSLQGQFKGLRRLRVGDYRVIYSIFENNVLILHIAHRKEIYD